MPTSRGNSLMLAAFLWMSILTDANTVTASISGKIYTLKPKDYVLEIDQGGEKQCISVCATSL